MTQPLKLFSRRQSACDAPEVPVAPAALMEGGAGATPAGGRAKNNAALAAAEQLVVGAVLLDNAWYDVVASQLAASDFLDPAAAAVYAALSDIIEGRVGGISTADPITLATTPSVCQLVSIEDLRAWSARALGLDESAVSSYGAVVSNAAGERRLDQAIAQVQVISREDLPLSERTSSIQQAVTLASRESSIPSTSIGAAAVNALRKIAENAESGQSSVGMTTGFPDLDALLAGLHPGQLIILAARPGVGKTAFAICLGLLASAAGTNVCMASMEMLAEQLGKRALSIISDVDSHALRVGALSEVDWEAVVAASETLCALPFEIIDSPGVSLALLSAKARQLKRAGKLGLLIVDYLQIMDVTSKKGGSREQEVAALSRGLKRLAMQLGVPIIALSQLNRTVENRVSKRPQMSDLRESGAIEQDADVIMFIHRESADDTQISSTSAELIVAKQRDGPVGVVTLGFSQRNTRFFGVSPAANDPRPLSHAA